METTTTQTVSKLDQFLIDRRNKSIADFKANVSETAFNRVMSVIKFLEAKGVKTEISVHFDRWDNRYNQTMIGFNKSGNHGSTWDWFKVIDFDCKETEANYRGCLWFNNSYSQITGKAEKGTMWGINTRRAYEKRFGVDLDSTIVY